MREDERLVKKLKRVEDRERLFKKLKKEKKKMVSLGATSSETKKIRKAIRYLKEEEQE